MQEKLRFYVHYFRTVSKEEPKGVIEVTRSVFPEEVNIKSCFSECTLSLTEIKVTDDIAIEDVPNADIVDFANMYIGGSCLQWAAVQEEILFLIFPELYAARLINICMRPSEAIVIKGLQKFASYKGYGATCQFAAPHIDTLADKLKGDKDCIERRVIAIDAIYFYEGDTQGQQFSKLLIDRELKKAVAGFQIGGNVISTGRWGCGSYNGSSQLKLLIQWIAASFCKRGVVFNRRKDEMLKDAEKVIELYKGKPMNLLYSDIIKNGENYFKNKSKEVKEYHSFLFKALIANK